MKNHARLIIATFALVLTFGITACETDEDNKMAEAQQCLDKAKVPADGTKCFNKVSGISSDAADRIRCAARFLEMGFTTSKFATVFESLEDDSGSSNPILGMTAELAYAAAGPGATPIASDVTYLTTQVKPYCVASGSSGLAMLAGYMVTATIAKKVGAGNVENGLENFDSMTPAEQEAIAGVVADMADDYCVNPDVNPDICGPIQDAQDAGTTDAIIAQCLGEHLAGQDPLSPVCQ